MKYKDNKFTKFQEKQRNTDYRISKTERQARRERELFYQKFLLGRVDKFWWRHLSDSDKDEIINSHYRQNRFLTMSLRERVHYWWSGPTFNSWNEWFEYIKTTFEPNRVSLREDKLKTIGI